MSKSKPFEQYIGEVIDAKLAPHIARLESVVAQLNQQKKLIKQQFDTNGLRKIQTRDKPE